MIWTEIFLHELADNLKKWRWWGLAITMTLLFVLSAVTYRDYARHQAAEYERSKEKLQATFAALRSAAELRLVSLEVMKRPLSLSWVVFGSERRIPDSVRFNMIEQRLDAYHSLERNLFLRDTNYVDWVFIVTYCLTLAAVLLGHDSISGELADGTLKLVLAQPISRAKFLSAKVASLVVALSAALTIAVCAALAALTLLEVDFSLSDLAGFGGAVALAVLLASVFLMVSVWASILSASSEAALMCGVLMWVLLVVLTPGSARIGAQLLSPVDSPETVRNEILQQQRQTLTNPDEVSLERFKRLRAEIRGRYERELGGQADTADWLATISPVWSYRKAVAALTDSGVVRHVRFLAQTQSILVLLAEVAAKGDESNPPAWDLFERGFVEPSLPSRLLGAMASSAPMLLTFILAFFVSFLSLSRLAV